MNTEANRSQRGPHRHGPTRWSMRATGIGAATIAVVLLLGGCSGSGEVAAEQSTPATQTSPDELPPEPEPSAATASATDDPTPEEDPTFDSTVAAFDPDVLTGGEDVTVKFLIVDYGYDQLPNRVRVGTSLSMDNMSEAEQFHTVIIYRLDDGDTRTASELSALPFEPESDIPAGYGTLAGLGGTPIGTLSAPFGAPGRQTPGGAFALTLDEPGRYVLFDTLPVGVDFIDAAEAENNGDFSALQDGPFHYQEGELAIIEVVDEDGGDDDAVQEDVFEEAFFYGDAEEEVQLFAGATAEDFCNDIQPTATSRVSTRDDGSVEIVVEEVTWQIYLYDSPLGGPELIDATCEALFDDDPDTVPLQPYATGQGLVRARNVVAPDGSVHVVNSTQGSASAPDGTTWRVSGSADLQIVDGIPQGDPAEFQGLRVERIGG